MNFIALTRQVSPQIGHCELTHLQRQPINYTLACEQHRAYEQTIQALGHQVISLPPESDFPDSVFVEDTAFVLDEFAVMLRPGAESRLGEVPSIARALHPYRHLYYLQDPATIDGGDILLVGQHVYIGLSSRSNREAVRQISEILEPRGYKVTSVEVHGCLHLKSAVTLASEDTLLLNPAWIDMRIFADYSIIEIDPQEPHAANALMVGESVIYPAGFQVTAGRMRRLGLEVIELDVSELMKAEGAVTCCSLLIST